MKHELNIDKLGEILCSKARSANREIIRYYGSTHPDMIARIRFTAQLSLVRDLGILVDLSTDEEDGKELYTAITIAGQEWKI
jgi:hypothetical protein